MQPRIKNIGKARLYRPSPGEGDAWPVLGPVLSTRTIDWDLIAQQYDQMVKYATALRLGTAEADQVLRRFTRGGPKHPTYQGIEELGRVARSIFICDYLASPELRREVHEGLRDRTLWRMLYETAARAAEILALDVEDLDLRNRRARVRDPKAANLVQAESRYLESRAG